MARYEVLTGMNYPPNGDLNLEPVRREVGDRITDVPPQSLAWLLAAGHLRELAEDQAVTAHEKHPAPTPAKKPAKGA